MNFHKFEKGVTEKVIEENKERFRDDIDRMIASAMGIDSWKLQK